MCQQGATPRSPVPSTEIGRTHTAHAVGSPRGGLAGAEQIPASPRRQPCGSIPATTPSCPLRFLQGKVPPSHIADGDLSLYRTANDTFPLRICPARSVAIACCVHRRNSDGEALRENPHSSRCGLADGGGREPLRHPAAASPVVAPLHPSVPAPTGSAHWSASGDLTPDGKLRARRKPWRVRRAFGRSELR